MSKRLNLRDKMQEINQKFTVKSKSSIANEVLENKLANIKKKMLAFSVKNEQEMTNIKNQGLALLQRLEENNANYERETQMQLRQLQNLEQVLHTKIEGEVALRKEKENALIDAIQKRLKIMRAEIDKQKKERMEVVEQITATLRNDVPALMNEVIQSAQARKEEEEKLGDIIEGEMAECETMTQQFKERQENNNSKIYGLIRDLTMKARRQVEEQKAVREQTHEQILNYVQQTCNRLSE